MAHRNAQPCPHCGKMFFPDSLRFHLAACQKKQAHVEVPCPGCDMFVKRCDLDYHVKRCPEAKAEQRRFQSARLGQARETVRKSDHDYGSEAPVINKPELEKTLRVLIGAYQRIKQDLASYEEEARLNRNAIESLRSRGIEDANLRQPKEVLRETLMLVRDSGSRLSSALDKLDTFVKKYASTNAFSRAAHSPLPTAASSPLPSERAPIVDPWAAAKAILAAHQLDLGAARSSKNSGGNSSLQPSAEKSNTRTKQSPNKKQSPASAASAAPNEDGRLRCPLCERGFAPDRLGDHQRICRKLSLKPVRQAFSSEAKRLSALVEQAGGSYRGFVVKGGGKVVKGGGKRAKEETSSPTPTNWHRNWRRKHEEMLEIARAMRGADKKATGGGNSDRGASSTPSAAAAVAAAKTGPTVRTIPDAHTAHPDGTISRANVNEGSPVKRTAAMSGSFSTATSRASFSPLLADEALLEKNMSSKQQGSFEWAKKVQEELEDGVAGGLETAMSGELPSSSIMFGGGGGGEGEAVLFADRHMSNSNSTGDGAKIRGDTSVVDASADVGHDNGPLSGNDGDGQNGHRHGDTWECRICTFSNPALFLCCEVCGLEAPPTVDDSSTAKAAPTPQSFSNPTHPLNPKDGCSEEGQHAQPPENLRREGAAVQSFEGRRELGTVSGDDGLKVGPTTVDVTNPFLFGGGGASGGGGGGGINGHVGGERQPIEVPSSTSTHSKQQQHHQQQQQQQHQQEQQERNQQEHQPHQPSTGSSSASNGSKKAPFEEYGKCWACLKSMPAANLELHVLRCPKAKSKARSKASGYIKGGGGGGEATTSSKSTIGGGGGGGRAQGVGERMQLLKRGEGSVGVAGVVQHPSSRLHQGTPTVGSAGRVRQTQVSPSARVGGGEEEEGERPLFGSTATADAAYAALSEAAAAYAGTPPRKQESRPKSDRAGVGGGGRGTNNGNGVLPSPPPPPPQQSRSQPSTHSPRSTPTKVWAPTVPWGSAAASQTADAHRRRTTIIAESGRAQHLTQRPRRRSEGSSSSSAAAAEQPAPPPPPTRPNQQRSTGGGAPSVSSGAPVRQSGRVGLRPTPNPPPPSQTEAQASSKVPSYMRGTATSRSRKNPSSN